MRLRLPVAGSAVVIAAALALPALVVPDHRPGIAIHRDTRSEPARAGEGTVNHSAPETAAQFKVVYAYAADRPNRFVGFQDALQADVSVAERFLSAQSGGTRRSG